MKQWLAHIYQEGIREVLVGLWHIYCTEAQASNATVTDLSNDSRTVTFVTRHAWYHTKQKKQ